MKVQKPKRHHYVVETRPSNSRSDFKFAAIKLTYTGAEQVASKLARESVDLDIRIVEKRLVWRNY